MSYNHSETSDFSERLKEITSEYGSRYKLARASGIPASTLQSYEAGSKPGMDALTTLAQVANVDIAWLLYGRGEMRPKGSLPGTALGDVFIVDRLELGTAFASSRIVGHIPFSRTFLAAKLRIGKLTHERLLAIEAGSNLFEVKRGDFVLIDRDESTLARDGIYLFDLPGTELRGVFRRPNGTVRIVGSDRGHRASRSEGRLDFKKPRSGEIVMPLNEFLLLGRSHGSEVIGRAMWIGRGL